MPSILLIAPLYNEAQRLLSLLESLYSQTCTDWVIVFGDNASDDASASLIREAAQADPRIHLQTFKEHVTGDQNFLRSYKYARSVYSATYAGFVGSDDKYENRDYLSNLIYNLEIGNLMAIPEFIKSNDGQKTIYLPVQTTSWENQLSLSKNWDYVHAIYSLFSQPLLDNLLNNPVSKPNSCVGFDWWFVFAAFQLAGERVCFVNNARYFKFDKLAQTSSSLPYVDLTLSTTITPSFLKLLKICKRKVFTDVRWKAFLLQFIIQNRKKFSSIRPIRTLKVVFFLILSRRPG